MGKIASMAKAGVEKLKNVFGKGHDDPPPTGEVAVEVQGYQQVPEPVFRAPPKPREFPRYLHVSKPLVPVDPKLQMLFGLPPFLVSGERGSTLDLHRNWAKRRAARISKLLGDDNLTRKRMRRAELEGVARG